MEEFSERIFAHCREACAGLVCMAGFLQLVRVPDDYLGRVMNIHPALIPAFCGKGYYGHRVHEAVLAYGVRVSGCTVHFADNEYDHGPIILQRRVPVRDDDTADTLAQRVFAEECEAYPEAIRLYAEGRSASRDGTCVSWRKRASPGRLVHKSAASRRRPSNIHFVSPPHTTQTL